MKKNNNSEWIENIRNKFANIIFKFKSWSFVKHILIFYIFITIIGSLILFTPMAHKSGVSVGYIDSLFTAASSFSDTGLVTLTTSDTWSYFGQAVIAILILVGGIGWFALKVYIFNIIFRRPLSFRARETLAGERGSSKVGGTRRLVKVSVTILFVLIIIAALTLSLYFYFVEPETDPFGKNAQNTLNGQPQINYISESPYHDVGASFRFGLFHAISGLNNAGFDIMGGKSLEPYYHRYWLQIIFIILFVIGGIGYPVIYDIYLFFVSKANGEKFHWSLFTKLSTATYLIVVIIGLSATFGLEATKKVVEHPDATHAQAFWHDDAYGTKGDKTMALIFNTMSTRNAGFGTIEMDSLSHGTTLMYSILMFIGSAPSSTAGGIRTTTIAIVFLGIWSKIRGHSSVRVFNRRLKQETVHRAYVVVATSIFIVLAASMILMSSWASYGGDIKDERLHDYSSLLFETASAFGTTGLSTGITSQLSAASKITLILVMFIGQLGVSSTLLVWDSKKNKSRKYKFVEEDVTIG